MEGKINITFKPPWHPLLSWLGNVLASHEIYLQNYRPLLEKLVTAAVEDIQVPLLMPFKSLQHLPGGALLVTLKGHHNAQQKSEELLFTVDGTVQSVEDEKNIDTTVKPEHDAKTSAAQEEEMVKTTSFCNNDVVMDSQDNMHLSDSGGLSALTGNKDRVSATSASDASMHQTSSHLHPQSHQTLHLWNWLLW